MQIHKTVPLKKKKPETLKLLHKTIKKVGEDIEGMRFNTAISQLMIFTNHCLKTKAIAPETAEIFTLLLSPFAPHLGEELWQLCGKKSSNAYESWPLFDPHFIKDDLTTMAVQFNGKTRGTLEVEAHIELKDFLALVRDHQKLKKYLVDVQIVKEIFIPGKICNIITK